MAGDAGVDAALVHYFFKSKDGLFAAAMELPLRPAEVIGPVLAEGLDGVGERIVRRLLSVWDEQPGRAAGHRAGREHAPGRRRGAARVPAQRGHRPRGRHPGGRPAALRANLRRRRSSA